MSRETPEVGEVSADGASLWDGWEWRPVARARREPTAWTRPLRLAAAGYLAAAAVTDLVVTALVESVSRLEAEVRASNPGLPAGEAHSQAVGAYAATWAFVAVVAIVYVVLAIGSLRGWRWAFVVSMVALGLEALVGGGASLLALTGPPAGSPAWANVIDLALAAAGLVVLLAMAAAAVRYGPWAMRSPVRTRG